MVRALRAPDRELHFVYEAGPCGFGIYRHLSGRGEHCVVVSPWMVPRRSGDRVKTDRRDSLTLARLHRAGELRAICVPDDADEAMRDLLGTQAKYRLKAFLLRQGRRYPGREGWTLPYRRWLADLSFPTAAQHITLQEYRVSFITAVALVAELGDLTRFGHPRELMAYLGLVPSEYSSGPSVAPSRKRAIPTRAVCSRKRPARITGFPGLAVSMRIDRKRCPRWCATSRGRLNSA